MDRRQATLAVIGALLAISSIGALIFYKGHRAPEVEAPRSTTSGTLPSVREPSIDELLPRANPERGKLLYLQCRACHTLDSSGAHKSGPGLYGMFSRRAGSASGFNYSQAIRGLGAPWTPEQLDQWFREPWAFLPGNRMSFIPIAGAQDRADLISYLLRETAASDPKAPTEIPP